MIVITKIFIYVKYHYIILLFFSNFFTVIAVKYSYKQFLTFKNVNCAKFVI